MMDFLKKMFSATSEVSSKRVLGAIVLAELLIIIALCLVYLWKREILEIHMATLFTPLVVLVASFFGLTLAEYFNKKSE